MDRPLRIGIIGAGPAGLTLARLLQKKQRDLQEHRGGGHWPKCKQLWEVVVYEAYTLGCGTSEGGSLDLRQGSGFEALQEAGLMAECLAKARLEGQDMRAVNMHGDTLYNEQGEAFGSESTLFHPEVDRGDLNQLLRESLDARTILWGHKLARIERSIGNREVIHLEFTNVEQAVVDLVVGADGAWSKVWSALSTVEPVYSGMTFIDCALRDFDARYPELVEFVGDGSVYAFSYGRVLITQRNAKGILRVYLGFKAPQDLRQWPEFAVCTSDAERAELFLKQHFGDWGPGLQRLVKAIGEGEDVPSEKATGVVVLPLFELPVGHSWMNQPGLTLIGDAAHLMSPCAGEGVNVAMADALSLATAVTGAVKGSWSISREELNRAVSSFEAGCLSTRKARRLSPTEDFEHLWMRRSQHPKSSSACSTGACGARHRPSKLLYERAAGRARSRCNDADEIWTTTSWLSRIRMGYQTRSVPRIH